MIARYREAFDVPGALAFSVAGLVGRFPVAMYPIALVLLVSARTGSYGFAGVVSGCFVAGGALGNPVAGAMVDRYGQTMVLRLFTSAHVLATLAFAVLISTDAPLASLAVVAVPMGATQMNVGALVRARWSYVWPAGARQRSTAYSVESTLDELVYVVGPLLATVLATHTHPFVVLGVSVGLIVLGAGRLTMLRSTEPPVSPRRDGPREFALRRPGMVGIAIVMAFMGMTFSGAEVALVAFAGEHGDRGSSGYLLAGMAAGSGVAGLLYGARHWSSSLLRRFVVSAVAFAILPLAFLLGTSIAALAVISFVVGLGIAPTLIAAFGLVDEIMPARMLTAGLTWIGTSLSVGYGIGASTVGNIADAQGARTAFGLPIATALCAGIAAVVLARRMLRLRTVAVAADVSRTGSRQLS